MLKEKTLKNKKALLLALTLTSIGTTLPMMFPVQANALTQDTVKQVNTPILKSDHASVDYTKFIENGGGELWVKLSLEGAEFNTKDPYKIKDAITQNYDIQTSLLVGNDGKSIEFGVYAPNQNIEYLENWEITIDSSVLTSNQDASIKIPVRYNMATTQTPKVVVSKQSVTMNELKNGFDLTLKGENGALFNTQCAGGFVRQSIMRTANFSVFPIAYCNGLQSDEIKLFVRALNGVPNHVNELEFRIEGNATTSEVPLIVRIPIVR